MDDLDIWSHTNDTIGSVRRGILNRIKANATHTKIELFIGGEAVDPADDRKLIGQLNLKDKTVSPAPPSKVPEPDLSDCYTAVGFYILISFNNEPIILTC